MRLSFRDPQDKTGVPTIEHKLQARYKIDRESPYIKNDSKRCHDYDNPPNFLHLIRKDAQQ
jgi:hypothetical protein